MTNVIGNKIHFHSTLKSNWKTNGWLEILFFWPKLTKISLKNVLLCIDQMY